MDNTLEELYEKLKEAEDLDTFLNENKSSFQEGMFHERINKIFDRLDMTKADLARRASMSEVFVHQIFSGTRFPSRNKLVCLCLAMGLDVSETNHMLSLASFATLAPMRKRDCVIMFGIENCWTVAEINKKLKEQDQPTLK